MEDKPGRHVMLDNLAAGITDDELVYLFTLLDEQQGRYDSVKDCLDIAHNRVHNARARRCQETGGHSSNWHMGGRCGRCGDID